MNFLIGVFILISQSAQASQALGKRVGQLGLVEGVVLVDEKRVTKNAEVREGSTIEVKDGKATLLLGKGAVFNLGRDSKMVVTQFGVKEESGEEEADLNLNFGRTRALILNQGSEKKDIKIRARAATMGVRGTEIYIDAPKDQSRPIQFFTVEGKAEVMPRAGALPISVLQNQGLSTQGLSQKSSNETTAPGLSIKELKAELKRSHLENSASQVPQAIAVNSAPGTLSSQMGMGAILPIRFDPIQDRFSPLSIRPHFCNANTGICN